MAISGHKRLATLQRYVKPSQAAVAALMAFERPGPPRPLTGPFRGTSGTGPSTARRPGRR